MKPYFNENSRVCELAYMKACIIVLIAALYFFLTIAALIIVINEIQ